MNCLIVSLVNYNGRKYGTFLYLDIVGFSSVDPLPHFFCYVAVDHDGDETDLPASGHTLNPTVTTALAESEGVPPSESIVPYKSMLDLHRFKKVLRQQRQEQQKDPEVFVLTSPHHGKKAKGGKAKKGSRQVLQQSGVVTTQGGADLDNSIAGVSEISSIPVDPEGMVEERGRVNRTVDSEVSSVYNQSKAFRQVEEDARFGLGVGQQGVSTFQTTVPHGGGRVHQQVVDSSRSQEGVGQEGMNPFNTAIPRGANQQDLQQVEGSLSSRPGVGQQGGNPFQSAIPHRTNHQNHQPVPHPSQGCVHPLHVSHKVPSQQLGGPMGGSTEDLRRADAPCSELTGRVHDDLSKLEKVR